MITEAKNGRKEKIRNTLQKEFSEAQASLLAEVITDAYNDLVKTSDFNELKAIVKELAEAQKKSEVRIGRLEQAVEELAEAQKRTEQTLLALIGSHTALKSQVGGLSHTVGYRLEDESYKALPALLKKDMGVEVTENLKRDFIEIGKNKYMEINIFGEGRLNGEKCIIVGEAKKQLKKVDIDNFIKRAELLSRFIPKKQIRILVTYQASPHIRRYADEKGIKIYFSYEF